MDPSSLKGFELGKLVLSSGLLPSSWKKISELQKSNYQNQNTALGIKIYKEEKFTIVVFVAPPKGSLDSASTLLYESQDHNPFPFLCSEKIDKFSVHTRAFELFSSAHKKLTDLKTKLLESEKPVIITGAVLGGAVASLFTLWLLENIDPKLKTPLCITFGSPLIGDAFLQQILENSVRNSCFLHVVDAEEKLVTAGFKPFGTFLICYDAECVCIEDPDAVMELLTGVSTDVVDYGDVLNRVEQSVLSMTESRLMIDDVIDRMKERAENKKLRFDSFKKLNEMKISMVYMEWYKKKSKMVKMGYYDRFKSQIACPTSEFDIGIMKRKTELNDYWDSVVEDVEKKPQSDISILKRRFLFSGNNYRRIVEPLDIAEYYLNGGEEYRTLGRSRRYVMLEKWFGNESIKTTRSKMSDLSALLTFDSCFWAEVEEAMIVINQVNEVEGMIDNILFGKLVKFEEYVLGLINKREVSPEIFLEQSSFMSWWKEYEVLKGRNGLNSSPSQFTEFMATRNYETYGHVAR